MKLNAEESLLLLCSCPFLNEEEEQRVSRLVQGQLDWRLVLWRAENFRVIPYIAHHLARANQLDKVPDAVRTYLHHWCDLSRRRSIEQFRLLGEVLGSLEAAGIDFFLIKGAVLSALYSPDPLLRPMQDMDIVVHPSQVRRAQQTLFQLGFAHGVWNPADGRFTPMRRKITEPMLANCYQIPSFTKCVSIPAPNPGAQIPWAWRRQHLKMFVDGDTLIVPVFLDVHVNLSKGMDLADVWRGVERQPVLGRLLRVQSATAALWFIASRLYHEAFQYNTLKLNMFGDVNAILRRRGRDVDWAELAAVAIKYGLQPALYYVIAQASQLTKADVPAPALELLKPDPTGVPMKHDWGDVMPKLFSRPDLQQVFLS